MNLFPVRYGINGTCVLDITIKSANDFERVLTHIEKNYETS